MELYGQPSAAGSRARERRFTRIRNVRTRAFRPHMRVVEHRRCRSRVTDNPRHRPIAFEMANASKQVVITNTHGLHTRPVMKFVDVASRFSSEIKVHKGGKEPADADGKSVMQMIILAAEPGTPLVITAQGDDAHEAVKQLAELVENKFGEDD